ncbi:MAG: YCF48-related protein [Myxococcota bacterium]
MRAMNTTRVLLALALTVFVGCDVEEPNPAPVGKGSAGPANGGSKGTTGGTEDDGDDDGGTPDDDGGSWAVGRGAEMIRIAADGSSSGYDLRGEYDLLGIACHGDKVAWAVGTGGTILYTNDAGERWRPAATQTDATLRAVAISSTHVIFAVGDDGSVLVSRGAGAPFDDLVAPAIEFTGVASNLDGSLAFATAFDGSIWAYDVDHAGLHKVWQDEAALHSIAMTPDAARVVAVGDDGTWLQSLDEGRSFERVDVETDRDLYAVQLAASDELGLAVGEAGTVVQVDALGPVVQQLLDAETALRAVHLSGTGHGIAVGDAGVAFTTRDAGERWEPTSVATTRDLFGVDEISLHGHL